VGTAPAACFTLLAALRWGPGLQGSSWQRLQAAAAQTACNLSCRCCRRCCCRCLRASNACLSAGSRTGQGTLMGRWLAHSSRQVALRSRVVLCWPAAHAWSGMPACLRRLLHTAEQHALPALLPLCLSMPPLVYVTLQACGLPDQHVPNMLLALLWASQVCCLFVAIRPQPF